MTELLTLEIESIAAGGDGIARHNGLVVFVPRTAPGDRVVARVEQKSRLARGIVERIERAAAERVRPECPHYEDDQCGGCQLQHLSLDAQRDAKRLIVRDAFRRIGHRDVALPEVRGGGTPWRYRRKLTLALRRTRGEWCAGLHTLGDPDRIFRLDDCRISDQRLMSVWREVLAAGAYLPNIDRLRGAVRLLQDGSAGAAFVLEGAEHWPAHATFFSRVPSIVALWWTPERGTRRLLHDRRPPAASGEPGASFVQVNPEVASQLHRFVVDSAMSHTPSTAIDAYAGSGTVAAALAARGMRVTAIELDADASRWSAAHLPAGSRAVHGRVEDALRTALPADVVILNPPRAGVDARVTRLLASASRLRAIIYVSCDPATLARDAARLTGWQVARLTAFDMFPQTAHVETVCELVPEAAP